MPATVVGLWAVSDESVQHPAKAASEESLCRGQKTFHSRPPASWIRSDFRFKRPAYFYTFWIFERTTNSDRSVSTYCGSCHMGELQLVPPFPSSDLQFDQAGGFVHDLKPISFHRLSKTERRSTVTRLFAAAWNRWGLLLRRCERNGKLESLGEAEAGSAGKQPRQGITESKSRSHSTLEGRCMSAVSVGCTVLFFLRCFDSSTVLALRSCDQNQPPSIRLA